MTYIYKTGHVINNEIQTIFVFFGSNFTKDDSKTSLDELFKNDPENQIFNGIFTREEMSTIFNTEDKTAKIPVVFINDYIHLDDTVETIKKKVMMNTTINASFEEIYLFSKKFETLNSIATYQTLTQNDKLDLTKERLVQFLLNMDDINIDTISDKEIYTYDDILLLGLDNKQFIVSSPIGQSLVAMNSQFSYTVNPFNVLAYDPFFEKFAEDITTTDNQNILMNSLPIYNNMIYICTAESVLHYATETNLSQETTIKIYFPYLFKKEITSDTLLAENKQQLLIDSDKMLSNEFKRNINNVNLFYNIYYNRTSEISYTEVGIKEIEFTIHPNYSFNLPLDVVFKLIHATENVPLIKFNPAQRQEKIYRLYANKLATNGKKIPYLNKAIIFRLMKNIGLAGKRVAVYIEHFLESETDRENKSKNEIICEFVNNGDITVKASFIKGLSAQDINKELALAVNPVINIVKDYLSQSGYSLNNFTDLNSSMIEILNMDYIIYAPILKPVKLKEIIGCVSSIFNVIDDDITHSAVMRFKRVANYNEMDSQEALIIELINNGSKIQDIITALSNNFQMNEEKARNKLANFTSSVELQTTIRNKKIKIKNNPGFLTTIVKDNFKNVLNIKTTGINDIRYLATLPVYIDSILRITQDPQSSTVAIDKINNLCKKSKKVKENDVSHIKDILATTEILQAATAAADDEDKEIIAHAITFDLPEEPAEEMDDDLFNLLFSTNAKDEDEDKDKDADENEDEITGGAEEEEEEEEEEEAEAEAEAEEIDLQADLTGKSLSHPNLFFQKLQKQDPSLFLTKKEGKFNSYSRSCSSQYKRQPVILTNEEKEKIDKEHPGSYDQSVQYGSNPDKKFWYICPRYWSLKDNVSLTEEEAKSGKYGNIIPTNSKKIPPGGNVYEFNEKRFHGEGSKYIQHNPGFLKNSKHPQGKCIPCCFTGWDSKSQKERRDTCTAEAPAAPKSKKTNVTNDYIIGADKFPLDQNRYGYLPLIIQKFIHTDNKKCQISLSNTNLKPNHPCFVRHGVEANSSQSFIACVADVWVDIVGGQVLKIKEMKEVFINALTIDNFMTLQNGNLVDIFYKEAQAPPNIDNYTDTTLYKITDKSNQSHLELLHKVIESFNNFITYLRDDTIEIDHTYLWDLISIPNPKLFPKGLNIVIVEILNNDITDNVQILCPSNHYSSHLFDINKKIMLLVKIEAYYEPIYIFEDQVEQFEVTRLFSLKNNNLMPNIKRTLEFIKYSINNKCQPFSSMPTVYNFETNIILQKLVHLLQLREYQIDSQVMNYNGKIIGVLASKNNITGFIPCLPSAPLPSAPLPSAPLPELTSIWMDDKYGNDYKTTLAFLTNVYADTKGEIPCKPVIKVIEDGLIVGILTQTNQFVMLSEPAEDIYGDDLETVNENNFIIADKIALTDKTIDTERVEYIYKIRLESSFYNVFRNTMRFLIGEFRYRDSRAAIEKIITSPTMIYSDKLKQVDQLLRELMKDHVTFSTYSPEILSELGTITNCYMSDKDECSTKKFCLTKDNNEDNTCALVIPDKNLISDKNNEEIYFGRMADELIRYNRIRSFIFQPKSFLAFSGLKYNLRNDEIILLQSLITQEFFEDLIPAGINKYVAYNTYDTAQPIKTQLYSNETEFDFNKQLKSNQADVDVECNKSIENTVTGPWAKFFSNKSTELIFSNEPELCSFDIILTLIKDNNKLSVSTENDYSTLTKYHLKEILVSEYQNLQETYNYEILQILSSQGKTNLAKFVSTGHATLSNIIMSYDYYATNLDIWILAVKFNIPFVFLSGTKLIENGLPFLVAHDNGSGAFYFIKSPSVKVNTAPIYKLIVSPDGTYKIPLESVKAKLQKDVKENTTADTLIEFIKNFSMKEATKRLKSDAIKLNKKIKLVVVD